MLAYQYCEIINDAISQFVTTEQLKKQQGIEQIWEGTVTGLASVTKDNKVYQTTDTISYAIGDSILFSIEANGKAKVLGRSVDSEEVPIKVVNDSRKFIELANYSEWPANGVSDCTMARIRGKLKETQEIFTVTLNGKTKVQIECKDYSDGLLPWRDIVVAFEKTTIESVEIDDSWEDLEWEVGTDTDTLLAENGESLILSSSGSSIYNTRYAADKVITFESEEKGTRELKLQLLISGSPNLAYPKPSALPSNYIIELFKKKDDTWQLATVSFNRSQLSTTIKLDPDEESAVYKAKIAKNASVYWESNELTFTRKLPNKSGLINGISFSNLLNTNTFKYWNPDGVLSKEESGNALCPHKLILNLALSETSSSAQILAKEKNKEIEITVEAPTEIISFTKSISDYGNNQILLGTYIFKNEILDFSQAYSLRCSLFIKETGELYETSAELIPTQTGYTNNLIWRLFKKENNSSSWVNVPAISTDDIAVGTDKFYKIISNVKYKIRVTLYNSTGGIASISSIYDQNNTKIYYQASSIEKLSAVLLDDGKTRTYYRTINGQIGYSDTGASSITTLNDGYGFLSDNVATKLDDGSVEWELTGLALGNSPAVGPGYQYAALVNGSYYFGIDFKKEGAYTGKRALKYGTDRALKNGQDVEVSWNGEKCYWAQRAQVGLDAHTLDEERVDINFFNPKKKKAWETEIVEGTSSRIVGKSWAYPEEYVPLCPILVQVLDDEEQKLNKYLFYLHLDLEKFASSILNDWDGNSALKDKYVLSSSFFGGKVTNDQISGVIMGELGTLSDASSNEIGLFGYKNSMRTFSLTNDGVLTLGAAGSGQIVMDGTSGKLYSGNNQGGLSGEGVFIDLKDGNAYFGNSLKVSVGENSFSFDANGKFNLADLFKREVDLNGDTTSFLLRSNSDWKSVDSALGEKGVFIDLKDGNAYFGDNCTFAGKLSAATGTFGSLEASPDGTGSFSMGGLKQWHSILDPFTLSSGYNNLETKGCFFNEKGLIMTGQSGSLATHVHFSLLSAEETDTKSADKPAFLFEFKEKSRFLCLSFTPLSDLSGPNGLVIHNGEDSTKLQYSQILPTGLTLSSGEATNPTEKVSLSPTQLEFGITGNGASEINQHFILVHIDDGVPKIKWGQTDVTWSSIILMPTEVTTLKSQYNSLQSSVSQLKTQVFTLQSYHQQ